MASVYDILGTVLGALSLLGCIKTVYKFLKDRQPLAQAKLFEAALRDARQHIDELEQHGYLSENPNLSAVYRSALARIDRESLRVRAQAERHRAKSVVAVLVYSCRHGVKCTLSRQIGALTKLVQGIRHQLDFPLENPYVNYSGIVPNKPKIVYEEDGNYHTTFRPGISEEVKSAVTGTQLYRSTEGLKYRNISWASDPHVDADIASQLFAIRARRMQRIQARLDVIAQSVFKRAEVVRNFPSNIIWLNRLLMIERGILPPDESGSAAAEGGGDPAELNAKRWASMLTASTLTCTKNNLIAFTRYEENHLAEREAASREMNEIKKQFQALLDFEFADTKIQSAYIDAKLRPRSLVGASRRTASDTPTAVMASGASAASTMRTHQD